MQIEVTQINWKIIGIDALIIASACLIPALSHLTAQPLYYADPMRWLLLAGLLVVANKKNGYLLAVALPLIACLLSGMPAPVKAVIIMVELTANVAIFHLLEKKIAVFSAMLLSIVAAKIIYYALKALIIAPTSLISTNVWLQTFIVVLMSIVFAGVRKQFASK